EGGVKMSFIKEKRLYKILLFAITMLLFFLAFAQTADAKGKTFKDPFGKELQGNHGDISEYVHANIDGINEFEVKDKNNLEIVYEKGILKLDMIVEKYKACKDDDCKSIYKEMFGQQQQYLWSIGIGIEYPDGGISKFGAKHMWVYTSKEGAFFQG